MYFVLFYSINLILYQNCGGNDEAAICVFKLCVLYFPMILLYSEYSIPVIGVRYFYKKIQI